MGVQEGYISDDEKYQAQCDKYKEMCKRKCPQT